MKAAFLILAVQVAGCATQGQGQGGPLVCHAHAPAQGELVTTSAPAGVEAVPAVIEQFNVTGVDEGRFVALVVALRSRAPFTHSLWDSDVVMWTDEGTVLAKYVAAGTNWLVEGGIPEKRKTISVAKEVGMCAGETALSAQPIVAVPLDSKIELSATKPGDWTVAWFLFPTPPKPFQRLAFEVDDLVFMESGRPRVTIPLGTVGTTGTPSLADAKAPECKSFQSNVVELSVSDDGSRLAAGGTFTDQGIRFWSVPERQYLGRVEISEPVLSLDWFADKSGLALTTSDGTQLLRMLPDGSSSVAVRAPMPWTLRASQTVLSPDSRFLVALPFQGDKQDVVVWQVADEKMVFSLAGHEGFVRGASFNADGTLLATAGGDGIRIWKMADGTLVRQLGSDSADSVAFASDSKRLVSGTSSWDRKTQVHLYDLETGAPLASAPGHRGGTAAVALSPDGTLVATAGDHDGSVGVLKLPELTDVRRFTPHDGRVSSVAFVDGGRSVVSAGWDGSVRLSELESGKESCLTAKR